VVTGRLAPDFKTIADFRKDNGAAIRAVCRRFVELAASWAVHRAVVAIDAASSSGEQSRQELHGGQGHRAMERSTPASRGTSGAGPGRPRRGDVAEAKSVRLKEKIAGLRRQMQALKEMEQTVQDAPDQQVSLTDPSPFDGDQRQRHRDRRLQCTDRRRRRAPSDRGPRVINQGYDRHPAGAHGAEGAAGHGREQVTAVADRGYFNGDQVLSCEGTGVAPVVPRPDLWQHQARPIHRAGFHLRRREGSLHLPGRPAPDRGGSRSDRSGDIDQYRHLTACFTCPLKPRCTAEK